jgi:hypothetical protein
MVYTRMCYKLPIETRLYSVAVITSGSDHIILHGVGHPGDLSSILGTTFRFAWCLSVKVDFYVFRTGQN